MNAFASFEQGRCQGGSTSRRRTGPWMRHASGTVDEGGRRVLFVLVFEDLLADELVGCRESLPQQYMLPSSINEASLFQVLIHGNVAFLNSSATEEAVLSPASTLSATSHDAIMFWSCQEMPKQRPSKKQRSEMERCSAQTRVMSRLSAVSVHSISRMLPPSLPSPPTLPPLPTSLPSSLPPSIPSCSLRIFLPFACSS